MLNRIIMVLSIFCIFILSGCQGEQNIAHGYLIEIEDNNIIMSIIQENGRNKHSLTKLSMMKSIRDEEGKRIRIQDLKIGHKVKVWLGNSNQSFPGSADANRIIVENFHQTSEVAAIAKAVEQAEKNSDHFFGIKSVHYNDDRDYWEITMGYFEQPATLSNLHVIKVDANTGEIL